VEKINNCIGIKRANAGLRATAGNKEAGWMFQPAFEIFQIILFGNQDD
jgi:hypothetical protein